MLSYDSVVKENNELKKYIKTKVPTVSEKTGTF